MCVGDITFNSGLEGGRPGSGRGGVGGVPRAPYEPASLRKSNFVFWLGSWYSLGDEDPEDRDHLA